MGSKNYFPNAFEITYFRTNLILNSSHWNRYKTFVHSLQDKFERIHFSSSSQLIFNFFYRVHAIFILSRPSRPIYEKSRILEQAKTNSLKTYR